MAKYLKQNIHYCYISGFRKLLHFKAIIVYAILIMDFLKYISKFLGTLTFSLLCSYVKCFHKKCLSRRRPKNTSINFFLCFTACLKANYIDFLKDIKS